jgi:beta-galactosidase
VTGERFRYVFGKLTGTPLEMVCDNFTLLEKPVEYNIWRAPTDNDRNIRHKWQEAGYDRHTVKVYSASCSKEDGCVKIEYHLGIAAVYIQRILEVRAVYTVGGNGIMGINLHCRRDEALPFLPRFGLRLFLPKYVDKVTYFGYGPQESYVDKHHGAYLGRFETEVSALHEDYIKPQENGSHYGCRFVELAGGSGYGLNAASTEPISFNASVYTQEELTAKAHNFELEPSGYTVLCVDYAQSGLGSNSCGPELLKKYRFDTTEFTMKLWLTPRKR